MYLKVLKPVKVHCIAWLVKKETILVSVCLCSNLKCEPDLFYHLFFWNKKYPMLVGLIFSNSSNLLTGTYDLPRWMRL